MRQRQSAGCVAVAWWANYVYYWVWRMPEFDINVYWREQAMQHPMLPQTPGW